MKAQAPFFLILTIVAAGFFCALIIRGLRQRKVITFSNLNAERDRSPVIYWVYQAYYATAVVLLPIMGALLSSGYKFGRDASIDGLLSILFGGFFVFAAIVIGTTGVVGLRTGVAIRSSLAFRRAPPLRKKNPVRYWSLQAFYLLATIMLAFLGAGLILVTWK